ncbi:MAG TPA: amino acid permease [Nitrospirales bacterium]|nr:amino acid permease [Nitrospirales bacterium]
MLKPVRDRSVFRTKCLLTHRSSEDSQALRLKRDLTVWHLVALGIGAIIGTGVFVLIGTATVGNSHRPGAGPGIILSFLCSGMVCALAALCYAEFASMIPVAGSAYSYTYATLGELIAWLVGWNLILEYGVASAAVAIGWSGYFVNVLKMVGIELPDLLAHAPEAGRGGLINLPAVVVCLVMMGLLLMGTKRSAQITGVIVVVKLFVILFFLAVGVGGVNPENWSPFLPNGLSGVGAAAAIVFFAYVGFDAVSTAAEEARNPQRDIPRAILVSLGFCTLIYISVAAVLTGLVPVAAIDVHAPVAEALSRAGYRWGAALVAVGALAGITSVLLVMMLGQIRVFFAMSRDGLLSPCLAAIHSRFQTPSLSTILTGSGVALLAGFIPIGEAADMTNIGTLFAFCLVCVGVLWLRITQPEHPRPFRLPWMPWIPVLGTLSCFGLMLFLPSLTWMRFGAWTVIGLLVYAIYGHRHSRLATHHKDISRFQ